MNQLTPMKLSELAPATEDQQMTFVQALVSGRSPVMAATVAGSDVLSLYLARCSSADFDDLWNLALLARRDTALHEVMEKSLAATGTVVWEYLIGPDGSALLDEDFNAVRAPRLVGCNPMILSKLIEKLMASADKPAPTTSVNVSAMAAASVSTDLRPLPRLINPETDECP
ncbi:hypothetical protein LCGC14_1293970 [marine sediment metagenome]|uniref:SseB protein N-terminal domain-containing protein n=1 Tax=marine sediment metagenome TaxID=412755 RepID=A0A0F9LCF0_9ZZZZ